MLNKSNNFSTLMVKYLYKSLLRPYNLLSSSVQQQVFKRGGDVVQLQKFMKWITVKPYTYCSGLLFSITVCTLRPVCSIYYEEFFDIIKLSWFSNRYLIFWNSVDLLKDRFSPLNRLSIKLNTTANCLCSIQNVFTQMNTHRKSTPVQSTNFSEET